MFLSCAKLLLDIELHMWAKVQAFHMWCQHRILSVKWNDFIQNVTVSATSDLDNIINIVRARRLGLFSHVARFSHDVSASNILTICCTSGDGKPPDPSWRHSSRTTWVDHISSPACEVGRLTDSLAQDHSQWRAVTTATKATHIWPTDFGLKTDLKILHTNPD